MSTLSTRCIRAAFACLALGVGLGVWFALDRARGPLLRPLHAELNLWGWTTLLIYGMGYHMLPRFSGRPLPWPRLAEAQSWLAIAGVALVVGGGLAALAALPGAQVLVVGGGAAQLLAALLFTLMAGWLVKARSAAPH